MNLVQLTENLIVKFKTIAGARFNETTNDSGEKIIKGSASGCDFTYNITTKKLSCRAYAFDYYYAPIAAFESFVDMKLTQTVIIGYDELTERMANELFCSTVTLRALNFYAHNGTIQQKKDLKALAKGKLYVDFLSGEYIHKDEAVYSRFNWKEQHLSYKNLRIKMEAGEIVYDPDTGDYFTTDVMNVYLVDGEKMPLSWIINHAPHIAECECGALTYQRLCQTCYPGMKVEDIYLQYSARATDKFKFKATPQEEKQKKKPLYMGIELELEERTTKNLLATHKMLQNHAIIKRDGSVSEGMEICSAPATLDVHKAEFKKFFEEVGTLGLKSKANCGMHVHVDKESLSELQIGKMLSFMNNPDNKNFISIVAERSPNEYCAMRENLNLTSGVYYDEGTRKIRRSFSDRYTALNLVPRNTVEFRIFAATTKYAVFIKNLEFVKSMVDFTAPCRVNLANLKSISTKEMYLNFIKENRKDYPYLVSFLKDKQAI